MKWNGASLELKNNLKITGELQLIYSFKKKPCNVSLIWLYLGCAKRLYIAYFTQVLKENRLNMPFFSRDSENQQHNSNLKMKLSTFAGMWQIINCFMVQLCIIDPWMNQKMIKQIPLFQEYNAYRYKHKIWMNSLLPEKTYNC